MGPFAIDLARLRVASLTQRHDRVRDGPPFDIQQHSGVVLPAFLPTVNDLVLKVGGGDPLAVALSINAGAALVDVSPLSTLGALCVAAVSDHGRSRILFRQLMIWGVAMALVGALLCQLLAGAVARA